MTSRTTAALSLGVRSQRSYKREPRQGAPDTVEQVSVPAFQRVLDLLCAAANLANEDDPPQQSMQKMLALICGHGDWDLARLVIFGEGPSETRSSTSLAHAREQGRFAELLAACDKARCALTGDLVLNRLLIEQQAVWLEDVATGGEAQGSSAAFNGDKTCLFAFPVIVANEAAGIVELFSQRPRPCERPLLEAAGSIGSHIARLIERHRSTGANARLGAIVACSADAIMSRSLDGTITSWNAGAERMFGYAAEEALGRPISFFLPATRAVEFEQNTRRLLSGEVIPPYESQRLTKDGRLLDVLISLSSLRSASGEIEGASFIVHDISALKKVQERLQRANRAQRVLAQCSHAVVRATNELQLLRDMCRILVDTGGYARSWVGYLHHDAGKTIEPIAYAGFEPAYLESRKLTWSADTTSMTGIAIATGQRSIWRNILTDPRCAHLASRARACGFQSVISLPLYVEGECIGGFALYAHEADAFDDDEIALIATLSDDVAFGIASLRREAARMLAEANLQRLVRARRVMAECNRALVHANDEQEMLNSMCRIVVESGGYKQGWIGLTTEGATIPVQPIAYAGYGNDAPMTTGVNWTDGGSYRGLAGEAVACGEIRIARDILRDTAHHRKRERALQLGYQSSIALPLKAPDGISGVFVVHAAEPEAFYDDELALLSDLADDIAFGVSSLRLRAKHKEAEAQRRAGERQLRETFEQAAVGIMRVDLEGRLVDANQKLCDLLGYTKEELLAKSVKEITHPDDYGSGARFRQEVRSGSTGTLSSDKRYLRADGSAMWARRTMSVACDDSGLPHQVISIVQDITHSKELERRFELTFNHAPLGIMHTAVDSGRLLHANPKLCDMLGYAQDELLGLSLADIVHPACGGGDDASCREQMLNGKLSTYSSERLLQRKQGSSLWTITTVSLVRSAAGEPQYFIRMVEDISERKQALEMIARERALLRSVVDAVPERIYVKDREGRLLLQNAANTKAHGARNSEDLLGKTVFELFPYETAKRIDDEDRMIMKSGKPLLDRERSTQHADGEMRWIASSKAPLVDTLGNIFGIVGVNRDITERKRMERELTVSEQTLRATFTHAHAGITVISLDLKYLDVNDQYSDIVGYSRDELLAGMRIIDVCVPECVEKTVAACRDLLTGETHSDSREERLQRKNGQLVWVTSAISLVRDSDGNAKHFVSVTQDISGTKLAEERLVQLAHYDTLTGLPNRALFNQKVRESLAHARTSLWRTGVMFIDVDRFKNVNDTLGHIEGDKLLQQISARLSGAVRRGDSVGRLGGDEFAVVLTDLAAVQDAAVVAQKVVASFAAPFRLGDSDIYVTASIGIALHPDHATDQDTLIRNADAAMYEAKKRGRNGYQFYTPELNDRAVELLTFESDLRRALERQEFVLHYQPKSAVATGEITGLEALLRWHHPVKGLVSPRDFIPLLEETGLIVPVGEWVFERVCRQIAEWKQGAIELVPISINISARQFTSLQLGDNFKRILQRCGTDPALIELELTESALMVNTQEATRTLEALKLIGLSLSIDDFGTGYSSLAYLKRFPLDTLKIDRSFVKDIPGDKDDCAITLAVISMAHSLGLSVVAEGVETEEQVRFLRQHKCDQLQGYYLAQPMPQGVCAKWLQARSGA